MNILVTYASKYGATAQIAEKIGEELRRSHFQVMVIPISTVRELTHYQALVLGSALYIGKWQKDAEAFLKANENALAAKPVWLFSSGPTGEGDPVALIEGKVLPESLQPVVERIRPRSTTVFGGYINRDKLNFMEKFAVERVVKKPFGDFRDWDRIAAWADRIASALKAEIPAQ